MPASFSTSAAKEAERECPGRNWKAWENYDGGEKINLVNQKFLPVASLVGARLFVSPRGWTNLIESPGGRQSECSRVAALTVETQSVNKKRDMVQPAQE